MIKKHKLLFMSLLSLLILVGVGGCMFFSDGISQPETKEWDTRTQNRVSIHDPAAISVIDEEGEETFYLFGTHVAQAKTKDFQSWEVPHMREYENMEDSIIFGNTVENLSETFEWAGHADADSTHGFNLWAPDVIWSDDFEWANGDTGAYLMFYSSSSTWRRSAIALMASPHIEGPYTYVDTIIYSGFSSVDSTDGSDRNINYEGTHLPELIDKGIISEFNDHWVRNGGREYNTDYAPNAIDPAPFYDENGTLWLVYGSWSGGIYLLELDSATGIPQYPGEDGMTDDGRTIDRYFGIKLSGGYHQSGEGPYIVYDEDSDYYYKWLTYGGLQAHGGYNMRLFRAENVTGPYVDAQGNSGIITHRGDLNSNYGIKLFGNYEIPGIQNNGYRAPGHNSVVQDQNGNWFNVFHTRFNRGTEEHEVRVHQMLKNQDEWMIPLPYRFRDELAQLDAITTEDIVGEYVYVNHGTENSTEMIENLTINLETDGVVSGDLDGNWEHDEQGYITLTVSDAEYNGIVTRQLDEEDVTRLVFAAFGNNNEMIWGIKP